MQRCSISFTHRQSRWFAAGTLFLALSAQAADPDPLSRCTAISDREQRWRCYDEVTGTASPGNSDDNPAEDTCGAGYTTLSRQWNTRPNCGSKLYGLAPYRQNYLIYRSSNGPNNHPTSAVFRQPVGDQHLEEQELKFQLSIKVKVAEQIGNLADLWFGYTQQSNWQAFNNANIRPFRNTDYEPELILGFPLRAQVSALGFTPRMINLGLVHQSNGQRDPFERSWNRVYAQIGLDRDVDKAHDRFAVLARAWYRLPETTAQDVNPDIQHYLGYGDLVFFWRHGDSNVSALLRNNLQTENNQGSLQLNWSIPITRVPSLDNVNVLPHIDHELRFYVQVFTGFGETLLDYNHYQTTIGIGIMLSDWM
jgi:phospholipase A1